MKKWLIILALLFFAHPAIALTVTLLEPADDYSASSTTVTFKCKTDETAENLTLYHNISGWAAAETLTTINSNTEYSFTVQNISMGNYEWNCLAAVNETQTFAPENYDFRIRENAAPQLTSIINNETWDMDTVKKIQLFEHFIDPDGDTLTYSSSPTNLSYITVEIDSLGEVKLTPANTWTGIETITFIASDTYNNTNASNPVTLRVKEKEVENRAPKITYFEPADLSALSVGSSQRFAITKSDPDNDSLDVQWYINSLAIEDTNSDNFTFTPTKDGTYNIKVSISDGSLIDTHNWNIKVYNATTPVKETVIETPIEKTASKTTECGNGKAELGENCANCPSDAGCPKGYDCLEEKCFYIKKARSNLWMAITVLSIFIIAAFLTIYFYKKKQAKILFEPEKVERMPIKKEIKMEEKKPEKFLEVPQKERKKELGRVTVDNVLLENYIRTCLARGKTFAFVKQTLLKSGWKEDLINKMFEQIKKERYKNLNDRFRKQ